MSRRKFLRIHAHHFLFHQYYLLNEPRVLHIEGQRKRTGWQTRFARPMRTATNNGDLELCTFITDECRGYATFRCAPTFLYNAVYKNHV